jgi:hypothetical protein
MFLKRLKTTTDPRVRSLLQKASRRGHTHVVETAVRHLNKVGDRSWLRSRAVVITFEECWPLAELLSIDREPSSKMQALLNVAGCAKQKDAAGIGALAYAYKEGDHSMADYVPDEWTLRIVAEALKRPAEFFDWAARECLSERGLRIIKSARQYLAAATWEWDKACILAGALLAAIYEVPIAEPAKTQEDEFPYWVALDKHTPQGKAALHHVALQLKVSYRQLIWVSFYCESATVNALRPSPWFEAEKYWRLRKSGLSISLANDLWLYARDYVRERLFTETTLLKGILAHQSDSSLVDEDQTRAHQLELPPNKS